MQNNNHRKYLIAIIATIAIGTSAYIIFPKHVDVKSSPLDKTYSTESQNNTMDKESENQLQIVTTQEGSGIETKKGDAIEVHYTGKLTDGKVFDSSIPRGETFSLTLGAGQVIQGWDQGLLGMKVGEKRTLTIPPALGYGDSGIPGVIPPSATLIFDVELVAIK